MFKQYDRVKLISDHYTEENIPPGSVGYIIEVYSDNDFEVEFSREDGTTFAQTVIQSKDIQIYPENS